MEQVGSMGFKSNMGIKGHMNAVLRGPDGKIKEQRHLPGIGIDVERPVQ